MSKFTLTDCETKEKIDYTDELVCACCGRRHDPHSKVRRLVIDHDRWTTVNGFFPTRILCYQCNLKKGSLRYVPFYPHVWFGGLNPGEYIPNVFDYYSKPSLLFGVLGYCSSLHSFLRDIPYNAKRRQGETWSMFRRRTGLTLGLMQASRRFHRRYNHMLKEA